MLHLQTNTKAYWTEDFEITPTDLDFIYNLFLEEAIPIKTPDLIQKLIEFRINSEYKSLKKLEKKGEFFQPAKAYSVGQEIIFPAYNFVTGVVTGARPGNNPEKGTFTVIDVQFEDGKTRSFASALQTEHILNESKIKISDEDRPDPTAIYERYKKSLTRTVVDALREDEDTLFIAKRWFLKSLLLEINVGHLNLAEAILDMSEGGPLPTRELAKVAEVGENEDPILQTVSLDWSLLQDDRFDEVGPAGRVLWFLKRMEPPQIQKVPPLLKYQSVDYNPEHLSNDLIKIEEQLDDELSIHELVDEEDLEDTATIRLIYPHLRSGTLPITQRSEHIFPIAYRTPRILITLVDGQTGEEMRGWVVRDAGYVFGLEPFYQRHQVPIGALIQVSADEDDPGRIIVDFESYKSRSEWLWLARIDGNRLRFVEGQMNIGVSYDDLLGLGVEDPAQLDQFAEKYRKPGSSLGYIMGELIGELAQFSPQQHVHAQTLYSAVNLLRRCPPAPIFAELYKNPRFANTGGAYWRLA